MVLIGFIFIISWRLAHSLTIEDFLSRFGRKNGQTNKRRKGKEEGETRGKQNCKIKID
jgi:hypothetical protein